MIRILLVGNDYLLQKALRLRLAAETDVEVVGEAGNAEAAQTLTAMLQPELVVIDAGRLEPAARCLIQGLDRPNADLAVVVLHDLGHLSEPVAGPDRIVFLCKDAAGDALVEAIRTVKRSRDTSCAGAKADGEARGAASAQGRLASLDREQTSWKGGT